VEHTTSNGIAAAVLFVVLNFLIGDKNLKGEYEEKEIP